MSRLSSAQRKIAYLVIILLLFVPIIILGRPEEGIGPGRDSGGVLANMRARYDLRESALGKVDPASSTMNFVLLGMRGFAASILWYQAQELQKTKNWAELRAVTESITMLQPHFQKVWDHQAWNLAYNVSADWDLVADRYFWVKEGLKFYQKGIDQNQKVPDLYWRCGNVYGQKIGRADEWKQYRRFFLHDPNTEAFKGGPDPAINPEQKDNYEVARQWFQKCNDVMDQTGIEQHIMARAIIRNYPVRALMDLATMKHKEGVFGEVTKQLWEQAHQEWTQKYGKEDFPSEVGMIHLDYSTDELLQMISAGEREKVSYIERYQKMTNYAYWRMRSQVEAEGDMVEARRQIYAGEQSLMRGELTAETRNLLEDGMKRYQGVLEKYPELLTHEETIEDAMVAQLTWRSLLQIEGEPVPDDYPLKKVWDENKGNLNTYEQEFSRRRKSFK